ncbi:MAG: hypothetical protein O3B43_06090 [Chloroflexi bacterium]|nr:hypothetical protein [Chloroflexota bacterium]
MVISWISIPAVFAVQIGFAGLLGALVRQIRARQALTGRLFAIVLAGFLILAACFVLPVNGAMKVAILAASVLAASVTAWKLDWISENEDWVWLYVSTAMGLILVWSIAEAEPLPAVSISLAAALAALLAWRRGMLARIR